MFSLRNAFFNLIPNFKRPSNTYTPAPIIENSRFSSTNTVSSVLSVQNGLSYVTLFVGSAQVRQQVCPEGLDTLEIMLFLNLITREYASEHELPVDPELPDLDIRIVHEIVDGDIASYSLYKIIRNQDDQILKVMVDTDMGKAVKMANKLVRGLH